MRIITLLLPLAACSSGSGNVVANDGRRGAEPPVVAQAPPPVDCATMGGMDEACVDWLPAERLHGIWVTGFEVSNFVPDAVAPPRQGDPGWHAIWLNFADNAVPDRDLQLEAQRVGRAAVAIEFDGRRARNAGNYGHMNSAQGLVIVDRIVSIRILGPLAR